jgi:hypothetical protein
MKGGAAIRAAIGIGVWMVTVAALAASQTLARDTYPQVRARYAGKALVVHIWGITCSPCLKELPHWGALVERRGDLNLVLIQADVSSAEASEQLLAKAGLGDLDNWRAQESPDEFMRATIDPTWRGDMPRTLLVAPNGKTTVLKGIADIAAVTRWLDLVRVRGR